MEKKIVISFILILLLLILLIIFNLFNPFLSDEEKIIGIWKSDDDIRSLTFYSGGQGIIDNNPIIWKIYNNTLEIKLSGNQNYFEYSFSNFNNALSLNHLNTENSPYSLTYYKQ